jgi:hypothetical protein
MAREKRKRGRWARRLFLLAVIVGAVAAVRNYQLEANERRYAPARRGAAA